MILYFKLLSVFIVLILQVSNVANSWPSHDVKTLRLLQVIHTHGDRTPGHFVPNDPYSDVATFWYEGVGQLTKLGRNRMYRIGKFFKDAYKNFVLRSNSILLEKFLYVRSSGSRRCLESSAAFVAGFLGGDVTSANSYLLMNHSLIGMAQYQSLATFWRPISINSIYPKGSDPMLDSLYYCPNSDLESEEMEYNSEQMQRIYRENKDFLYEISKYAGEPVVSLKSVHDFYQELFIETQHDYHWWKEPYKVWSDDYEIYVISKLRELSRLYWTFNYANQSIQRLRGGELIKEINGNIRRYIDGTDQQTGIFLYSTHDSKLALLLHAFGIFNGFLIPPGASIIIELHQNLTSTALNISDDKFDHYYLKLYYFNETYTNDFAYQMRSDKLCPDGVCSLQNYFQQTGPLEPDDIKYECGVKTRAISYFVANLALLFTNLILMLILLIRFCFCA